MPTKKKGFKTVDDYISAFPKDIQKILQDIRHTISAAAPGAEETISYQIPTFKLKGRSIAHFAAFKQHIGFYPPAPKAFSHEVSMYAGPRGNLKFPLGAPMPLDLVERIVKYRASHLGE